MSATKSNLSDAHYGYDFVVATTQQSINATLKEYLYNNVFPNVKMYWNQDQQGNPVAISYEDLMLQTNGTDPLKVPAWDGTGEMSQDLKNINNSNFFFAFEAAIGIPADLLPQDIPDIITMQEESQSVIFNLICANFTIVSCVFGRHGLASYQNISQPTDKPWLFTSIVALQKIINNTKLPQHIQDQLNNFGPTAFSVEQLLFDLDNAALESTPTISGLATGTTAYSLLSTVFIGAYFNAMKAKGQPVLNYTITANNGNVVDPSTLKVTNMAIEISPYVNPANGEKDNVNLNTLNYLCATNANRNIPPAVPFQWNWVEASDVNTFNGVIAINRNVFAKYIMNQLYQQVSENCIGTSVRVWLSGLNCHWHGQLSRGQQPKIDYPPTGAEVLTFSYSSESFDQAGLNGDTGRMKLSSSLNVSVSFSGNQITIVQHLVLFLMIRSLASEESGNIVDKTITDNFTLSVDQNGQIVTTRNSPPPVDKSVTLHANWFINLFTSLDDLLANFEGWGSKFANADFNDVPLNFAQSFVFPGGKTFTYKDVIFSEHQDLVSHITYVQQ